MQKLTPKTKVAKATRILQKAVPYCDQRGAYEATVNGMEFCSGGKILLFSRDGYSYDQTGYQAETKKQFVRNICKFIDNGNN